MSGYSIRITSVHIHTHIVLQLQSNFFISLVVMIIIVLQRITVLMMMDQESTTFSAPNVFIIDYFLDGMAYMFYFSIFAKVRLLRFSMQCVGVCHLFQSKMMMYVISAIIRAFVKLGILWSSQLQRIQSENGHTTAILLK